MLLNDLVKQLTRTRPYNEDYYQFKEFICLLEHFEEEKIEVVDTIIIPFYIPEKDGIYEFYYYELDIRVVNAPDLNNYLLLKTGHKNIEEIDKEVKERLNSFYLEVIRPNNSLPVQDLIDYSKRILTLDDVRDTINRYTDFSEENLYFQIY